MHRVVRGAAVRATRRSRGALSLIIEGMIRSPRSGPRLPSPATDAAIGYATIWYNVFP